ncbi:MAG TPA: hypothetical protein VLA48_09775 [Nitrososphaeraceae archaeon]|nr:hypothetical protein [Nitrososphaeraceae archaeon]
MLSARIAGCCCIIANKYKKKEWKEVIKKITQTSHILGLGIDISKSKANICLKEDSKVLENFIVTNNEEVIIMLINKLEKYININININKKEKEEENCLIIKTIIESTGNLWINMYEALER